MPTRWLLADLGNSRLKLALCELERPFAPLHFAAFDNDEPLAHSLTRLEREAWACSGWSLCSVASPQREREVAAALAELSGQSPRALEPGLIVEPREPASVGRDRLFAARAAWERVRGDCIALTVGTALTVALVRAGPRPRFAGGAIAPGPRLLAQALARGAARLFEIQPRPGVAHLGRDSHEALEAGVVHGLRGAARELVEGLERECELGALPVCVGGGGRALLLEPEPFLARALLEIPHPVLVGMQAAARAPA